MKNDVRSEVLYQLIKLSYKKRYVTIDDITKYSDEYSLSAKDFYWVTDNITNLNLLATPTPTQQYPQVSSQVIPKPVRHEKVYKKKKSSKVISKPGSHDQSHKKKDSTQEIPKSGSNNQVYTEASSSQIIPKPRSYDSIYREIVTLDPSLKQLVMDIRNIEPPRQGEIPRLQAQIINGDQQARSRMIEMHMRVALRVALSRAKKYDLNLSDTIDRAFFALIKAVDEYDSDQSKSKNYYLNITKWIYWNMTRDLSAWNPFLDFTYRRINQAYLVYPILKRNGCTECAKFSTCITARSYIKEKLKCSNELCEEVLPVMLKPLSIEKIESDYQHILYNYEKESIMPEGSFYPYQLQDKADDWDETLDDKLRDEWIRTYIAKKLNEKEARILEGRFGLNGSEPMTLDELGREFDLTRERIRQIEAESLRKLANTLRRNNLSTFIQTYAQSAHSVSPNEPHKNITTKKANKKTRRKKVSKKKGKKYGPYTKWAR